MNINRLARPKNFFLLLVLGAFAVAAPVLRAQDAPPSYDAQGDDQGYDSRGQMPDDANAQDPPSRVARLSALDGTVSFQPGGQGEWGAATRNRPVTVGDKIWSDNNSRAELQAGQASIHLSSMTALSFLNLDEQTTQMRLAEGAINFRVRELREGDVYEVDTPNVTFNVTQAGAFRIDVNENGDATRITAIRGEGQVTANGQTYTIHSGERGEFNGVDNVTYFVSGAPAPDGFDRWANDRDLREDNSTSARYVSREVPGYDDLDENGTWDEVPEYGHVWYPNTVDVGWAPYSYGYWNYVGPWGWTWVGYEPWGFAPYHYGRWAYIGNRWGWCPGPYYARPVYGPAFVGFIGGSRWGVGFGFGGGWGGGIGWFPLGWGEPYHPWYHASDRYYRNVNINNTYIRNTTIINNRTNNFNYAYSHNTNAVTVASRNNFVNGERINRGAFHVTEASLRGAQVSNRAGFSPNQRSYFGGNGPQSHISRPTAAVQDRAVMARTAPAAAASHMPVRTFGGNASPSRGGFNNNAGGFGNRAPVMGRTAEMGAAAGNNRPSPGAQQENARPGFGSQRNSGSGNSGFGNASPNGSGISARQRELSQDKPQSHMRVAPSDSGFNNGARGQANANSTTNPRSWSAQGNTTDRGRAPAGFGGNSPRNEPPNTNSPRANSPSYDSPRNSAPHSTSVPHNTAARSDRPPSSYNSNGGNSGYSVNPRPNASPNRPDYGNSNRSYSPPPSYNSNRGYSQPRSYNPPPSSNSNRGSAQPRSYNPPQRSYSQPSYSQPRGGNSAPRGYSAPPAPSRGPSGPSGHGGGSAPSHSSGGSGGHSSGSGGGSSHAGGSSHGPH
jgi:hypothetical protein